jgi:hypothetical protein
MQLHFLENVWVVISDVATDAWLITSIAILSHASFQLLNGISFEIKSDEMV